jgi:hypothetical protein
LLTVGIVAALVHRPYTVRAMLVLFVTALLMLALGSRAHLVVLCLVVVIHMVLLTSRRESRWLGIAGVLITAAVVAGTISIFLETRAAEILDLASSASWQERNLATFRALEIIGERPWMGNFGYHFSDDAGYAHNLLSAWTQYGLAGFVFFVLMMFVAFLLSLAGYFGRRGNEAAWLLALYFNFIAVVLAVAFEPIMSSVFPALAWGFTLRAIRLEHLAAYEVQ